MVALAAPALPMSALTIPLVTFLPEFYANSLGMNLTLVGVVFMAVRLLDIGIDPLLGSWMDRTYTRWGRYKPWLIAGVPITMVGAAFLMLARPGVGPLYLFWWLLVTYLGYSIITLAQLAFTSAQTQDYQERSRTFGWWQATYTLGLVLVLSLPQVFGGELRNDRATILQTMAFLIIISTPLTVLWSCIAVRDRSASRAAEQSSLADYFRLFKRRSTRLLMTADLLLGLSSGLTSTLGLIFFVSVKRIAIADFAIFTMLLFLVAMLAAPFWATLANRWGKHRVMGFGAMVNVLAFAVIAFIPAGERELIWMAASLQGISWAAAFQLPRSMLSDINDEELLDHGSDRNGLLYALLTGIYKIGTALAIGVGFIILDLIGFVPTLGPDNAPGTLSGVLLCYCGATSVLTLAAALTILRYPLTAERHAEIKAELDRRRMAADSSETAAQPAE
jgi:Na+/melibiose symporter-like transporter